jgi:hypothetical protein
MVHNSLPQSQVINKMNLGITAVLDFVHGLGFKNYYTTFRKLDIFVLRSREEDIYSVGSLRKS